MKASIKWLSHSGFIVTSSKGVILIIDPWITGNPLCPIKLEEITASDIVLVTHDHMDHISNVADIVKKTNATVVACSNTASKLQTESGIPANNTVYGGFGMHIGGSATLKGITITMVQAMHSSETATSVGYIIKLEDGTTIYHAGDTGIFESMRLFGEIYKIDIALIPIGGVFTMDSFQAAKALKLINPKVAIPMHYKTFPILEQDASRFIKLAKEDAPKVKIIDLNPGGSYILG